MKLNFFQTIWLHANSCPRDIAITKNRVNEILRARENGAEGFGSNMFTSFWAVRICVHEKVCYKFSVAYPRNEENASVWLRWWYKDQKSGGVERLAAQAIQNAGLRWNWVSEHVGDTKCRKGRTRAFDCVCGTKFRYEEDPNFWLNISSAKHRWRKKIDCEKHP